jgi:phosphopantothenoylcysteine decarboxylase/phosphopantothenate--cysteine ligase
MLAIITTGPASAPIDDVRHITNFATGEIGALLAEALAAQGFEPLLFRARGATHTAVPRGALLHEFTTNHDLTRQLEELSDTRAPDVRAIFHAAALSDYAVTAVRGPDGSLAGTRKIPGDLPQIHLVLEPAAKVLPRLRGWFPRAWIVGWKYELEGGREDAIEMARTQLASKRTDATILNGAAYGPGFGLLEDDQTPVHFATKREAAQFLASRAAAFAKSHK